MGTVIRTGHLKRELAVAAHLGDRHRLPSPFDLLALTVAAFARHLDRVRRTVHLMISELKVHDVVPGFGRPVRDVQRAVLVVLALDFSLARALDGQRQTAIA